MHILHVCRLYTPHIGGVETHVSQVAKIQLAQGNQVTIITTQHDAKLPLQEKLADGCIIYRLPLSHSLKKIPTWWWVWQNSALFRSADFIQVHDIVWWLIPVILQNRTKIVTTFHGWETTWPIPVSSRIQRRLYNWFSAATVHVGDWIKEYYGDSPDMVLYGGVTKEFLEIPLPGKCDSKKPIHFVFVGRLEADNAVAQYVQFFELLQQAGRKIQVTWVGDGTMRELCETVGTVVGWQKDTIKWIRVSDFVCASSYLSILQGLAAGRLVISLYTNELKSKYLKGFIGSQHCIIADSAETAESEVPKLLSTPEKLQQLQRAAKSFASTQTWEQVAQKYAELMQKMTGRSSA